MLYLPTSWFSVGDELLYLVTLLNAVVFFPRSLYHFSAHCLTLAPLHPIRFIPFHHFLFQVSVPVFLHILSALLLFAYHATLSQTRTDSAGCRWHKQINRMERRKRQNECSVSQTTLRTKEVIKSIKYSSRPFPSSLIIQHCSSLLRMKLSHFIITASVFYNASFVIGIV